MMQPLSRIPSSPSPSAALIPPPLPPRSSSPSTGASKTNYCEDYRGQLVLVDENDGNIVGSLGDQFNIRENSQVMAQGHEDPVLIEMPDENDAAEGSEMEVWVHPVPIDQQCNIMKTSSYIRCVSWVVLGSLLAEVYLL